MTLPLFLRPYFGTAGRTLLTVCSLLILYSLAAPVWRWAIADAVWTGDAQACRAAAGACWSYVGVKLDFFLFGFFPPAQQWRAGIAMAILALVIAASLLPRFWRAPLLAVWAASVAVVLWLMGGGAGLAPVASDSWGGLPLTLLLAAYGLALGYPLGILLALARTGSIPLLRYVAVVFIEGLRGVPFVAILFMASVTLPLLLPEAATPGKLLRAYIAYSFVAAAYFAEGFRGALLAMPRGQTEAAHALGMGYWQTMRDVILPQCVRSSLPMQVNTVVSFFKDTSLVVIIGLTDFLRAVSAGSRDAEWLGFDVEGYAFAAATYFCICFAMSRYSAWLEGRRGGAVAPASAAGQTP